MKKFLLFFAFCSFVAISNVSAQCTGSAAKAEGKSCCAKKAEGTASTATQTQVAGEAMVRKVAETTSCTKTATSCAKGEAKACCAKDSKTAATTRQAKQVAVTNDKKTEVE